VQNMEQLHAHDRYQNVIHNTESVSGYGNRQKKKNDADIQMVFPKYVCSVACATNQKASSKEDWVHTHISF